MCRSESQTGKGTVTLAEDGTVFYAKIPVSPGQYVVDAPLASRSVCRPAPSLTLFLCVCLCLLVASPTRFISLSFSLDENILGPMQMNCR